MFWHHPPPVFRRLWPDLVWRLPVAGDEVYLTFDDGPHPETTPRLLDWLGENGAKATFFCVGRQVERHPALFDRIKKEGHAVGNHTWSHLSGWTTSNKRYFEDIARADEVIGSPLFRPPYGRIRPSQIRVLREKYTIVLWDIMPGDYNPRTPLHTLSRRLQKHLQPGSVVVGHDKTLKTNLFFKAL
jgi:peptidoglycan/xylan/chitin deacetylase (PgdA/CDA1 family)